MREPERCLVRCAQRDIEPNQRNRYDEPEEEVPEDPCKYISHKLE